MATFHKKLNKNGYFEVSECFYQLSKQQQTLPVFTHPYWQIIAQIYLKTEEKNVDFSASYLTLESPNIDPSTFSKNLMFH